MIRILAKLAPREIDGADEVLEGVVAEVSSGNLCRLWPAMTYDDAKNQTRIAFFFEWRQSPAPNDIAEVTAYTNELMGKPPELMTETKNDPGHDASNAEWLRTGTKPARRRTN